MFFPERLPKRLPEILSERLPERLPARLPTGALDATARRVTIPHDERHDERRGKRHDDGMMHVMLTTFNISLYLLNN